MSAFDLVEPASLGEALALLDPDDPAVRAIAGGTALMLMLKSGLFEPRRLVSLRALGAPLTGIRLNAEGDIHIGAMVRLTALQRSPEISRALPIMTETLLTHSNVRVRNVASLGGNLAHGDPHLDLPPVLIAIGARIVAASLRGNRTIAIEDLFAGYYETVLKGDELITEIVVPAQHGRVAAHVKCTARSADDWSALGIAVSLAPVDGIIRDARIAIGAATEKAMRLPQTEALIAGRAIDDRLLREAGKSAAAEAPVIGDQHGSAAYKRVLVEVYLQRALRQALDRPPAAPEAAA